MNNDMVPRLSDIVNDWIKETGWPITIEASVQFPPLYWVETLETIPLDRTGHDRVHVYIGTIDNDGAVFVPNAQATILFMPAANPAFFDFIIECILKTYVDIPLLDKSKLPCGK